MTNSAYCPVIGRHVTRFTKLGGEFAEVTCPEFETASGLCQIKLDVAEGDPLTPVLEPRGPIEDRFRTSRLVCELV